MKTSLIIGTALLLLTTLSCTSEQNNSKNIRTEQQKSAVQPENAQNTSATSPENATIDDQSKVNSVNESIVIPPPQLNTGFSAQNSADAPVLNPPHGQPGHICEIPVGSPLPRSANNVQKANTAATNNPINTTTTPVVEEPVALNPPHGQPGHICEIPVGSPLPKGSTIPKVTNTNMSTTTSPVVATPKLNPPHGQPGHKCEIPVGSPL